MGCFACFSRNLASYICSTQYTEIIFLFEAKINAMDDLVNSGASAVSDPEAALMVTNAIKSIIGEESQAEGGGGGGGSVGLEVTTKAVDATEVRSPHEN